MGALIGQRACRLLAFAREAIDSTRAGAATSSRYLLEALKTTEMTVVRRKGPVDDNSEELR